MMEESHGDYKCICEGSNIDCAHCGGVGWTSKPIKMRSERTLSLSHVSPEPFVSSKQKNIILRVRRKIPDLIDCFLKQADNNPHCFVSYLRSLLPLIWKSQYVMGYSKHLIPGNLNKALENSRGNDRRGEEWKILASAIGEIHGAYERALFQKKLKIIAPPSFVVDKSNRINQCPHCAKMVADQSHHNLVYHPELISYPAKKKRLFVDKIKSKTSRRNGTALRASESKGVKAVYSINMANARLKDMADTASIENKMDAKRTWGGRFRDGNGAFGSFPVHDNMDDESSP